MAQTPDPLIVSRTGMADIEPFKAFETSAAGAVSLGVSIQDQTTMPLLVKANKVTTTTTLALAGVIDEYTVEVDSAVGFAIGTDVIITSTVGARYYVGRLTNVSGTTLTLDTPLDYAFELGQEIAAVTFNLGVDGTTPQTFSLRAAEPAGGVDLTIDVVKIIFKCYAAGAVDLSKFGNLTALTKGLVIRRMDGTYQNIANLKDNGGIALLCGGWTPFAASNPVQGQDGFIAELTLGGQGNVGVVIRVGPGEDLQFIVQDNLSTLTSLEIMMEGHVVQ